MEHDADFTEKSIESYKINRAWAAGRQRLPASVPFVELSPYHSNGYPVRVQVFNSFGIKDALKARGYRYNSLDYAWFKNIDTIEDAKTEAEKINSDLDVQLGNGR